MRLIEAIYRWRDQFSGDRKTREQAREQFKSGGRHDPKFTKRYRGRRRAGIARMHARLRRLYKGQA